MGGGGLSWKIHSDQPSGTKSPWGKPHNASKLNISQVSHNSVRKVTVSSYGLRFYGKVDDKLMSTLDTKGTKYYNYEYNSTHVCINIINTAYLILL